MRLVLDTNTVVSALLWEGVPKRLLTMVQDMGVSLFTSEPLIAELADVLSRRKFERQLVAAMVSSRQLVELYVRATTSVRPVSVPRLVSDPDDDVVIGTGVGARAGFVVTGDHALLEVAQYEGVRIVSVVEALRIVASL